MTNEANQAQRGVPLAPQRSLDDMLPRPVQHRKQYDPGRDSGQTEGTP